MKKLKTFVPDYYDQFHCLIGECRHTCCAGWEIDIDEDTIDFYSSLPEEIKTDIFNYIEKDGGGYHFRLREDGKCPFLCADGRCRLIIEQGEDILCDICADHPRFRNYFAGREEIGLGLCCEGVGALILNRKAPVKIIEYDEDAEDVLFNKDEINILHLRDELIALAQNRTVPIDERVRRIEKYGTEKKTEMGELLKFMSGLEHMDDQWAALLSEAGKEQSCSGNMGKRLYELTAEWETSFEQILVYLLYRHIPDIADSGNERGHISFCTEMWKTIVLLCHVVSKEKGKEMSIEIIAEVCRMFSSEIEYSDENPKNIILFCSK